MQTEKSKDNFSRNFKRLSFVLFPFYDSISTDFVVYNLDNV